MGQCKIFKQPFKKSITIRTVFYSTLMLLFAVVFVFFLFQINHIIYSWKFIVVYISLIILIVEFLFLGLSLFIRSNYVILYDDRLVCVNRFYSRYSKTYLFDRYTNYKVLLYIKSPYAFPFGKYAMICFCALGKKWWKMNDYSFIASVSSGDCTELAKMLGEKGFDVKIYN